MSRIASYPISIPSGVEVKIDGRKLHVKGSMGELSREVNDLVSVEQQEDGRLKFTAKNSSKPSRALSGTERAQAQNMVTGVSQGFERRLQIIGVGYRAAVQGKTLNLTLGHSHPINFEIPEGVTVETPTQTEVVIKGVDKQLVGYVAAKIRSYRPPEPYKGKGVKYAEERIVRKEAKKA